MRDRLIFAVLFLAGVAAVGLYWWSVNRPAAPMSPTAAGEAVAHDPANPVMVIDVTGEANGPIEVELFRNIAPNHVARIVKLVEDGAYDGVIFHRVIDGFMAQSGDVQFGKAGGDTSSAGMGGSDLPDLKAEFSEIPFERGIMGMARSASPDSANSQFFIMFASSPNLNGQYTVVGQVISGLDVLDAIKRGTGGNGAVLGAPDVMQKVTIRP